MKGKTIELDLVNLELRRRFPKFTGFKGSDSAIDVVGHLIDFPKESVSLCLRSIDRRWNDEDVINWASSQLNAIIEKNNPLLVRHASGATSSAIPPYHLIPHKAARAYALRLGRGVRLRKEGAWNALSLQSALDDREFLLERLGHGLDHILAAIARVAGYGTPLTDEEIADGGDAGAIMFAGGLLACSNHGEGKEK